MPSMFALPKSIFQNSLKSLQESFGRCFEHVQHFSKYLEFSILFTFTWILIYRCSYTGYLYIMQEQHPCKRRNSFKVVRKSLGYCKKIRTFASSVFASPKSIIQNSLKTLRNSLKNYFAHVRNLFENSSKCLSDVSPNFHHFTPHFSTFEAVWNYRRSLA